MNVAELTTEPNMPPKRYLTREEAAGWLGMHVDTFSALGIPFCEFGPRLRRWDIVDIVAYADDTKRCDSARTSDTKGRQQCVSSNVTAHRFGGHHGTTRKVDDAAKALGLTIRN